MYKRLLTRSLTKMNMISHKELYQIIFMSRPHLFTSHRWRCLCRNLIYCANNVLCGYITIVKVAIV
ncbi:hypothetical protein IC575_004036 [Cucumis melo]